MKRAPPKAGALITSLLGFATMITKQPDGAGGYFRTIKFTNGLKGGRRRYDPWLTHAVTGALNTQQGSDPSSPLQSFVVAGFTLKSGAFFFYIYGSPFGCFGAVPALVLVEDFQVPGYPGDWTGEGYNAILRPQSAIKLTNAAYLNFIAGYGRDATNC